MMIPDALFDAAIRYRKGKLYKKLYDGQLYAVKHSDGQIGYCSVMGMVGESIALADFIGPEGLVSLYEITGFLKEDDRYLDRLATGMKRDCVTVTFLNKADLRPSSQEALDDYALRRGIRLRGQKQCPEFDKLKPYYIPWRMDEEADQLYMLEALNAASDVLEKLTLTPPEDVGFRPELNPGDEIPLLIPESGGFRWERTTLPKELKRVYPAGVAPDDFTARRLSKRRDRAKTFGVSLFMLSNPCVPGEENMPVTDEPDTAPFFPLGLMIYDQDTDMFLPGELSDEPEAYPEQLSRCLLSCLEENGVPGRMLVEDERTETFLKPIAAKLGVKLQRLDEVGGMHEAMQMMYNSIEGDGEDLDDLDDEEIEERISAYMEMMEVVLNNDVLLRDLPDEALNELRALSAEGLLSPEGKKKLNKELKRRGLK